MEKITFEPTPEQAAVLTRLRKETGMTTEHLISQMLEDLGKDIEHQEWERREVQKGIDQLKRGECTDYDDLQILAEDIKARGREKLAQSQNGAE